VNASNEPIRDANNIITGLGIRVAQRKLNKAQLLGGHDIQVQDAGETATTKRDHFA